MTRLEITIVSITKMPTKLIPLGGVCIPPAINPTVDMPLNTWRYISGIIFNKWMPMRLKTHVYKTIHKIGFKSPEVSVRSSHMLEAGLH
jgi:hypothetical protein